MRSRLIAFVCMLALCGRTAPAATVPPLEFLPVPGSSSPALGTLHYDAGSVDVTRNAHWTRTFTLKNTSKQAQAIAGLRGSCGCETLLLAKGGVRVSEVRLAPGETADVLVDVRLTADQAGLARKYVWAYGPEPAAGPTLPLATLELDMALRQSVVFSPARLDFGKVSAGAGGSQSVTVTLDADLVHGPSLPPLTCLDGIIHATPIGPFEALTVNGKRVFSQRYSVALSPSAPAGRVSADLHFQPPPGDAVSSQFLTQPVLPVSGLIAGDLDALPSSVFFGSLPAGQPVTRTVVLSLASAQNAASLRVTSSAPWLQAQLESSGAPARHHLLTVTITKQAPAGLLQAKILVLSGRTRLEIPVLAELTK